MRLPLDIVISVFVGVATGNVIAGRVFGVAWQTIGERTVFQAVAIGVLLLVSWLRRNQPD